MPLIFNIGEQMKFSYTKVEGFEPAIIGLRLPMSKDYEDAKSKSDSKFYPHIKISDGAVSTVDFEIGKDDMRICRNLIKADSNGGSQPNSKFLRMIHAQVCVTAPLYWWKEMETYKIGTTTNSTSTMHKLADTPITKECFEMDDFEELEMEVNGMVYSISDSWNTEIAECEFLRKRYNKLMENKKHLEEIKEFEEAKKAQVMAKKYWKELIRLLPESWLQTRMLDCDYAILRNIYRWRRNHKLTEWHRFCEWIESLPYAKELICD